MEGAVLHYDSCELTSAISMLTWCSSRTSEVQVFLSLDIDVWGTFASTNENCYDQRWLKMEKVSSEADNWIKSKRWAQQQQLCVLKQINQAEWLSIVDGNELYYQACFGGMFVELTANHFFLPRYM